MRTFLSPALLLLVAGALVWMLYEPAPDVVLYCGVDQDQSQPIAKAFEQATGLDLRYEGETEAQRSIGLPQKLLLERGAPRADVFWANEIMAMVDLGEKGLLAPLPAGVADAFPAAWRDPQGRYVAFGARARVFLVNTQLLPDEKTWPRSLSDLLDPRWREMGLKACMARPLTGTTYTHAVALLTRDEAAGKAFLEAAATAGAKGEIVLTDGNGQAMQLARDASKKVAFCLTDTDDAWAAIQGGFPVAVVYPDQGEGEPGAVLIPNTVALIQGGPNPEAGARLLAWLVSKENEITLAKGPSAQIPLRGDLAAADLPAHVKRPVGPPDGFRAATIDWQAVGQNRDRWLDWLTRSFRPAP
jgi:iron(III) transport system substrate-binding protein